MPARLEIDGGVALHLDRAYERLETKLRALGARIERRR